MKRHWRGQHSKKTGSKADNLPKAALIHGLFALPSLCQLKPDLF
jgi:hypothetical protein